MANLKELKEQLRLANCEIERLNENERIRKENDTTLKDLCEHLNSVPEITRPTYLELDTENAALIAHIKEVESERDFIVKASTTAIMELKSQLAETAERDRWRVTADEPPTENGKYEVCLPSGEIIRECEFRGTFGRWVDSENGYTLWTEYHETHWRPLRTDKPTPENES